MRTIFRAFLMLGIFACVALFGAMQYLDTWSKTAIPVSSEIVVDLKQGMPLRSLASELSSKGLVDGKTIFVVWMRLQSDYSKLQAGSYIFKGKISPAEIHSKMLKGDVYIPIALQVTIPEGFTLKMLNERLAAKNVGSPKDLSNLVRDQKFIKSLGVNSSSLEGYTYPATYSFQTLPNASEFYQKIVNTFFEKLPPEYASDIAKRGLNLTQAVTFASLIELETMREEEKPLISEVIWSRLKRGEPLGIDAAIIYGIANYDGDLKWKDLKNAKNKYNTRIHRGLPPSPIGAASMSSLVAVLNPSKLGYYYYVLDSADPTRHVFSKTLDEHNRNVRKFLKSGGIPTMRRSHEQEGTH